MRSRCACALLLLGFGLWGCDSDEATFFPPGLEPLEVCTANAPGPEDGQPHPERMNALSGDRGTYEFAHARGYVQANIVQTWEAFQDPLVVTDRRTVARHHSMADVEEGYDVSFRVYNEVDDIITVSFEITWRQSAVEGAVDAPTVVAIRWQKTYGTTFITSIEGSIILRPVDDGTTEIEAVEFIKAAQDSADTIRQYLLDIHASVVARVHGQPLPTY